MTCEKCNDQRFIKDKLCSCAIESFASQLFGLMGRGTIRKTNLSLSPFIIYLGDLNKIFPIIRYLIIKNYTKIKVIPAVLTPNDLVSIYVSEDETKFSSLSAVEDIDWLVLIIGKGERSNKILAETCLSVVTRRYQKNKSTWVIRTSDFQYINEFYQNNFLFKLEKIGLPVVNI